MNHKYKHALKWDCIKAYMKIIFFFFLCDLDNFFAEMIWKYSINKGSTYYTI